jgi:hypothetical protein
LEHWKKAFVKCKSPLNCTSSHFIRYPLANKGFETIFFNEIKDLDQPLNMSCSMKNVVDEALSSRSESIALKQVFKPGREELRSGSAGSAQAASFREVSLGRFTRKGRKGRNGALARQPLISGALHADV